MGFRDLKLLPSYNSNTDDVLNDFYIKALNKAVSYKRIAGFFSSASLAISAQGIGGLLKNNGHMQLIVSPRLTSQDTKVIKKAIKTPEEIIEDNMLNEIEQIYGIKGLIENDYVTALGWLLANKLLEIKVAVVYDKNKELLDFYKLKEQGIFHMKVGILEDINGDIISFSGSINETASAWTSNIEEFKVFKQWEPGQSEYCNSDIKKFDLYWNDVLEGVKVYRIPEAVEKNIIKMVPNDYDIDRFMVREAQNYYRGHLVHNTDKGCGSKINLFDYQKKAIELWNENNNSMIFEMATGTGKTIAAIGCMASVVDKKSPIVFFIICPQNTLLLQWEENIKDMKLRHDEHVIADSTNINWRNELEKLLLCMNVGKYDSAIVYSTFDTYYSKDFINIITSNKKNINYMIVADEVHGLGSKQRSRGLLDIYNLRLGLSATPERWFDEIGTDRIINYFSNNKFEFGLHDALTKINQLTGKTYLTPYRYIPLFTHLEDNELEQYNELSKKILNLSRRAKTDNDLEDILENIIFQRANIHKNAINKYDLLEKILDELGNGVRDLIIYLSDKQMDRVISMTSLRNIRVHKFVQSKGVTKSKKYGGRTEREDIIKRFMDKDYQILLAIKCLDEGIDIPSAEMAILMSSSTNPREYIQRIGRVIRRYPGKEEASIYDMIIIPSYDRMDPRLKQLEFRIFEKEINRIIEIAKNARNSSEIIIDVYNILEEVQNEFKKDF